MSLKKFDEIKEIIRRRGIPANLLLGNGFSIGAFPNKFSYQNIFNNADFSDHDLIQKVFQRLGTHDFEKVMYYLADLSKTQDLFSNSAVNFNSEILFLKEILIKTISNSHPERPDSIEENKYKNAGEFLQFFRKTNKKPYIGGKIFSLNYDLLLYWILNRTGITKDCNDGFRSTDADDEYLVWSGEHSSHFADVWFLHGALHIFDAGTEIKKNSWNRTDVGLIDQTREALDIGYFPIFVTEGKSEEKREKILHNPYLYTGFRQFCSEMNQASNKDGEKSCLVIYGHSLDTSDDHILKAIYGGKLQSVYVSLYGSETSEKNLEIIDRCEYLKAKSSNSIDFTFFSAESTGLWT